jgi:uncharacterized protein
MPFTKVFENKKNDPRNMKKFAAFVIRFRLAIIIITLLITAFFGFFLTKTRINPDITTYLPAGDSVVTRFNYIGKQYSSSSMGIIIIETDDVFNKETIGHINAITNALKTTEGVDYVTSITSVLDIRTTPDSSIEISRLIDEYNLPTSPEDLKKVKDYTLSKELYVGRLVSKDCHYATIICRINQSFDKNDVSQKIKETVNGFNYPEKISFEGIPFQMLNIFDYIVKDLLLLVPLIILIILIILALSFRSLRGVLLPIFSVAMGIIWTMGLMALCNVPLTPISDAIPVILFAVGSAYGIHIINKFKTVMKDKNRRKEQAVQALGEVGLPVILAGVTTFMGFLSFIFGAYLVIIRDFGIFSSLGVIFILLISLTFIPAIISYLKVPQVKEKNKEKSNRRSPLEWLMEKIAWMATSKRITILVISGVIIIFSIIGIPLIKNKIDILNYFRENTDIRKSANVMNREFGGSIPIQILVRGDIQDPVVMNEIKNLQDFLEKQDNVQNAQSISDFIEQMNNAMGEGNRIPDSREKISNLWFMLEGEEILKQFVNTDKTETVIQAYMVNVDTEGYYKVDDAIDDYISKVKTPGVVIAKSGMPSVYANLGKSLMFNLIQSMIISLLLIFITMILLVKSFKGAITGIIPLVFTMIFIFGFMGVTGIAIDIVTVLIASITVGAGIDYSIHFVTTYRDYIRSGSDIDDAIRKTIMTSGKAIVINVVTIMLGFLVLIFANLLPLQQFGILIAVTMFISGFAAITLLPAIISLAKLKLTKKNKIISQQNN